MRSWIQKILVMILISSTTLGEFRHTFACAECWACIESDTAAQKDLAHALQNARTLVLNRHTQIQEDPKSCTAKNTVTCFLGSVISMVYCYITGGCGA